MFYFDYALLLQNRLVFSAYFMLMLAIASCYFIRSLFLRGVMLFLALLLTLYAGRLSWIGIGFVLALGGVFYSAFKTNDKFWRRFFFFIALLAAFAMAFLKVPGVYNWQVVSKITLTPDAIPYSLTFNFGKSLIGLFFLWFAAYTLANNGKWKPTFKTGLTMGLLATAVLIPLSYYLGYVRFEPKWTNFFYLWAIHNLLFTCIAEEALFRGMILKSLLLWMQHLKGGKWGALIISAALFGAAHYLGGPKYMLLASVAGLFYGYAFMRTEKIEAGVLTHFIVNAIHFLAFTYPALRSTV